VRSHLVGVCKMDSKLTEECATDLIFLFTRARRVCI
jgi:hypothetical protein